MQDFSIMPIEIKEVTDVLSGGGVVGGIVALITTMGWWLRRERSETAKTGADISASNAQTSASESHSRQIDALSKRVSEQGDMIIALSNQISYLRDRVSSHDASRIGANVLLSSLKICKECEPINRPILKEIQRLLSEDELSLKEHYHASSK